MRILTTGGAGQLGSAVLSELLRRVRPKQLVVSTRDPLKVRALLHSNVEVRRADFDDPSSLDDAFTNIDRLLLVSTNGDNESRTRQHISAVAAAARAGVGFIAYTSLANAGASPLGLARVHRTTEAAIRATGIPYSLLRNNWYVENETGTVQGAVAGLPVLTAAGDGKIGWAARRDLAEAAAVVLTGSGHEHTVYELSGPPRTYTDLAVTIGRVLGREVALRPVNDEAYEAMLGGLKVPRFAIELLVDFQRAARQGAFDVQSDDLERLLGRPATPLLESVARILGPMGDQN